MSVIKPIDRINQIFNSKHCGKFKIIEYKDNDNYTIQFEDNTIVKNNQLGTIKKGEIKNPNFKNIYNVACVGLGKYSNKTHREFYKKWHSMLTRCYNQKYHLIFPTYKNCFVNENWLNFQNFAQWCNNNYVEDFELDKDILTKNNKEYSENTCCFIPKEINYLINQPNKKDNLPTGINYTKNKNFIVSLNKFKKLYYLGTYKTIGEAFIVYKKEKELYIKEVAEIWKNKISEKVYNRLINYEINELE